jgi:mono/diheme cytochrome c family protein
MRLPATALAILRHLGVGLAAGLAAIVVRPVLATEARSTGAEQVAALPVVNPADPGEHLPSQGRSLFEELFAVRRGAAAGIDVPFPFAALLARIDSQLQRDPVSPLPPAKRVLIPLGRSLQRTAAAPEFFAYPRVLVAVDSPPVAAGVPLLKDRLYLGYQEQSAVIEIISYNEAAGRFEFQLLKDYRAGGKPRLVYANRSICFACHQNGSPIFSRALWDETNANAKVAATLLASGQSFHGIPPERGIDVPYAIDNASERANGFALTQLLWRAGCSGNTAEAQGCRAGLFAAALRYALSGGQTWTPDARFMQAVGKPLREQARRRWPGGLTAGNPDIPNRNPLQAVNSWPADSAARMAFSEVPARFDPLLARPAGALWRPDAPDALRQLVAGLAEFVADPDRRQLESALTGLAPSAAQRLSVPCRIDTRVASRWSLRCTAAGGSLLAGTLSVQGGRPRGGRLTRLALPDGTALNNLELTLIGSATEARATLSPQADGLPARNAAADAIASIEIRRGEAKASDGRVNEQVDGEATLEIRPDFAIVQQAIDRLVSGPQAASLFGPLPFPRRALFSALFAELGVPAVAPCCEVAEHLPPAQLEVAAVAPGQTPSSAADPLLRSFQPYCAACHQTAETFPPNFLQGTAAEVGARLRHCAPRLYVRLAMADMPPAQRAKTPMPPESMLPAFASDPQAWRNSPVRTALLAQVTQWLRAETGQAPQLETLLAAGYEALRPCLPAH